MPPLSPLGVVPIHPRPVTPLVEWRTYSPPTPISIPSPFEKSLPVWSRPSRTTKKSTGLLSSHSRTKSNGLSQPLKGMQKPMSELQMGTFATPCILTSRSHWVKEPMLKPTGSPQPTTGTFKHMDKNKDPWTCPIPFPSTHGPSTHLNPSTPFPPGSINFLLVPLLFTLTSPKQPTDLITGGSLRISRATTNWTTTCPVSTQSLSSSKPKQGPLGSQRPFAKVGWSWPVPPSNWRTWSVWRCRLFGRGTSSLLPGEDGRSQHVVALARAGGNVTGLR